MKRTTRRNQHAHSAHFPPRLVAKDARLRRGLVESISWAMVGIVVFVMLLLFPWDGTTNGAHLVFLDYTVSSVLGAQAAEILTPGALLWGALLFGYFPAVHARRTPAMPILLAATLWTFLGMPRTSRGDRHHYGGVHAWLRRRNTALGGPSHHGGLALSAVVRGTLVDAELLDAAQITDEMLPGIVPAALLMLAFLGKQRGLLPSLAPVAVIALIVVTPTFADLLGESAVLGWIVRSCPSSCGKSTFGNWRPATCPSSPRCRTKARWPCWCRRCLRPRVA